METTHKQIVLGILAHVDSGKTTLSEAMLYRSGAIRKLGRVDHKDAFLDTDTLEKARGITIFSKQALLTAGNTDITLLDTPGHVDFSTETERTLRVLAYAVLVVSGTDGVQSHTETLWRLLRRYHVPTFVFVNKMDLPGKSREELLAQLNHRLGEGFVAFDVPQADRDEALALCDENLMDRMPDSCRTPTSSLPLRGGMCSRAGSVRRCGVPKTMHWKVWTLCWTGLTAIPVRLPRWMPLVPRCSRCRRMSRARA